LSQIQKSFSIPAFTMQYTLPLMGICYERQA
jgi:hypothetical protein